MTKSAMIGAMMLVGLGCAADDETSGSSQGEGGGQPTTGELVETSQGNVCDVESGECLGCAALMQDPTCDTDSMCDDSIELLDAKRDCMCDQCAVECESRCAGSLEPITTECAACSLDHCYDEVNACAQDS